MTSENQSPPEPTALLLTVAPQDPCWQLRLLDTDAAASRRLLGWTLTAAPCDNGVPPGVARILTNAWAACARLTYLRPYAQPEVTAASWIPVPGGLACRLAPHRWQRWLLGHSDFTLFSTIEAYPAMELFDVPQFPWILEAQVVFLSNRQDPPPQLTYHQLRTLLDDRRVDPLELKETSGVRGLALPGPDGDFVELLAFDEQLWQCLQENLATYCQAAGVDWRVVSEQHFQATKWYG